MQTIRYFNFGWGAVLSTRASDEGHVGNPDFSVFLNHLPTHGHGSASAVMTLLLLLLLLLHLLDPQLLPPAPCRARPRTIVPAVCRRGYGPSERLPAVGVDGRGCTAVGLGTIPPPMLRPPYSSLRAAADVGDFFIPRPFFYFRHPSSHGLEIRLKHCP